jgi:hypothetical protein
MDWLSINIIYTLNDLREVVWLLLATAYNNIGLIGMKPNNFFHYLKNSRLIVTLAKDN